VGLIVGTIWQIVLQGVGLIVGTIWQIVLQVWGLIVGTIWQIVLQGDVRYLEIKCDKYVA